MSGLLPSRPRILVQSLPSIIAYISTAFWSSKVVTTSIFRPPNDLKAPILLIDFRYSFYSIRFSEKILTASTLSDFAPGSKLFSLAYHFCIDALQCDGRRVIFYKRVRLGFPGECE